MNNPLISICVNVDTRNPKSTQNGLFNGAINIDFVTDGVYNKKKFFEGFDTELIVFIDEHNPVDEKTLFYLREICDVVCIRKHTSEHAFNDYNYVSALSLARGKYVAHFDQDTAAFSRNKDSIQYMLDLLEHYRFISYPSTWSPKAVDDPTFGKRTWASTRFFICKQESLKLDEIREMIKEPEYGYKKYGDSPRRTNWTEHFLSLCNEDSVYYPPIQTNNYTIFTWESYESYTLKRLNEFTYDQIFEWHNSHPIFYPNNCNS